MKRTSILEAVGLFIKARQTPFNADLVKLWSPDIETQINVSADGGEPIPGKKERYTNGTDEWGPIRSPRDSDTNPHFRDYPAPWPLDEHAAYIGMSGWNWRERKSYWIGFELDDLLKHLGTGVSKEEIERVVAALKKLPYVMIRRGTSGTDSSGIHVYVFVAGIATADHNEHAALGRAAVAKIAADTGLDIQASIDVCGRMLWFWAKRASEAKRSYECLQESSYILTEEDLPNWRDYISKKTDAKADALDVTSPFPVIEATADHKRFDEEYDKRGWPRHNGKDCEYLHKAGIKETCEALSFARFPSISPGTDKTKVNCVVHRTHRGLRVISLGDEGPEWGETENGNPCVNYTFVASPIIRITTEVFRVKEESIKALRTDSNTYQNGRLAEVVFDAEKPPLCVFDNGAPKLRTISSATLTCKLSACARYQKFDKRACKWLPSLPTEPVVSAVLDSADYSGIRVIGNVVSCPMLRADGTIAKAPGYDPLTGLFLDIQGDYPDLMEPDVAVKKLLEVVVDFPFVTENHRSAWLALPVTLVSRAAFSGCCPFFLARANMSGTGKTMLLDAATMITEDREATRYAFPKDPDEVRKVVTSAALAGVPYLAFDNTKGKFGGPVVENFLTATRWTDRILGSNKNVDLPLNIIFMGTTNNGTITNDMVRRTCAIELLTNLERPDLRDKFIHPNLLGWIKDNRRELVIAALSIPCHYIMADKPTVKMKPWAKCEGWDSLVRASIIWAGLPDLEPLLDTIMNRLQEALPDGWEDVVDLIAEDIRRVDPQPQRLLEGPKQ